MILVCLPRAQAPPGRSMRRSKSFDLFAVGAERGVGCLDSSLLHLDMVWIYVKFTLDFALYNRRLQRGNRGDLDQYIQADK